MIRKNPKDKWLVHRIIHEFENAGLPEPIYFQFDSLDDFAFLFALPGCAMSSMTLGKIEGKYYYKTHEGYKIFLCFDALTEAVSPFLIK